MPRGKRWRTRSASGQTASAQAVWNCERTRAAGSVVSRSRSAAGVPSPASCAGTRDARDLTNAGGARGLFGGGPSSVVDAQRSHASWLSRGDRTARAIDAGRNGRDASVVGFGLATRSTQPHESAIDPSARCAVALSRSVESAFRAEAVMSRVCAWCVPPRHIGGPPPGTPGIEITHGMCRECERKELLAMT